MHSHTNILMKQPLLNLAQNMIHNQQTIPRKLIHVSLSLYNLSCKYKMSIKSIKTTKKGTMFYKTQN